ncbi:MAG TPA: hypothetical protein VMM36_08290 [Opitutaceae bacterium]|nr:hypothetical protein [Opitutaceae bacterium]
MTLKRKPLDSITLGAASVLFVGLGLWTLLSGTGDAAPPQLPDPSATGHYQPAALANPEKVTEIWTAPAAGGGDAWVFDVFTPPVIYYDVANHKFSVTPPDTEPGEARGLENAFGIELVEVKRTPYRIQLVGYVGSEGDYIATFEDVEAGETFLARPGRTIEGPGVMLRSFAVEKIRDDSGGGTAVQDTRATAIIRDLRQNRDVTLVQKVRQMNDAPSAVFRVAGELARNVEGRQGDTVTTADATYIIVMVSFDPPTAEVTREATGDRGTDVRRLEPAPLNIKPAAVQPGFVFPAASSEQNPFGEP